MDERIVKLVKLPLNRRRRKRFLWHAAFGVAALLVLRSAAFPRPSSRPYWMRVRNAMARNFDAYWAACAGHDEYMPLTKKCDDWLEVGASALDSIDTLLIMGLERQYGVVRRWAAGSKVSRGALPLRVAHRRRIFLYEVVVRALGALNSAYTLTNDSLWLSHARELGDALFPAYRTPTGCPLAFFDMGTNLSEGLWGNDAAVTAEAGTSQLELRTLATLTGNASYATDVDRCAQAMVKALPAHEPVTSRFDVAAGHFLPDSMTEGIGVLSFIEYLLKVWIAYGKRDTALRDAFVSQVHAALNHLVIARNGTTVLGTREWHAEPTPVMKHVSCGFVADLALGSLHNVVGPEVMPVARRIANSCYRMVQVGGGIAPDSVHLAPDGSLHVADKTALLRPELVEMVYVMYKVTGEEKYREWARVMWDGIERHATLRYGRLVSVRGVGTKRPIHFGKLHSFVFAKTLKFFYLIFREGRHEAPGINIDFHRMVFNTEAHPVRIVRDASTSPIRS